MESISFFFAVFQLIYAQKERFKRRVMLFMYLEEIQYLHYGMKEWVAYNKPTERQTANIDRKVYRKSSVAGELSIRLVEQTGKEIV